MWNYDFYELDRNLYGQIHYKQTAVSHHFGPQTILVPDIQNTFVDPKSNLSLLQGRLKIFNNSICRKRKQMEQRESGITNIKTGT